MKDKRRARDLIRAAKKDIATITYLPINEETAPTIIRNIYEAFRMLGEARLALASIKSADHSQQIRELLRINVETRRPLQIIENIKKLRHKINYDGYAARIEEAEDARDFADAAFSQCAKEIEKEAQ